MKALGTIKLIATCAVVMVAVPFALRVLLNRYQPKDAASDLSATEKLQEMFGDGRTPVTQVEDLLRKPHKAWTAQEAAGEPEADRWLAAHAKVVLPWEWSETAQEKDPEGHRESWRTIIREFQDACKAEIGRVRKNQKAAQAELAERSAICADAAKRLDDWRTILSTNGIPATLVAERLEKGWLWGFNRREVTRTANTSEELRQALDEETENLHKEKARIDELTKVTRSCTSAERELTELLHELDEAHEDGRSELALVVRSIRRLSPNRR